MLRQVRHSTHNFIGLFASMKMRAHIPFESLLERDALYLLDYESSTLEIHAQYIRILIAIGNKAHQYIPDFYVLTSTGFLVIEVKPEKFAKQEHFLQIFDLAARYCQERGGEFLVWTELEIRRQPRLENVKTLTQFCRYPEHPDLDARLLALVVAKPGITIQQAVAELKSPQQGAVHAAIMRNTYHRRIAIDLDRELISLQSQLTLTT